MKKAFPYIIIFILISAAVVLMMARNNKRLVPDETITLKKRDKIPYGTYIAFNSLSFIFPGAAILVNRKEPGDWDSVSLYRGSQALVIVAPRFYPNESEMENLIDFAKAGNDIFISARELSSTAQDYMKLQTHISFGGFDESDSLLVWLEKPPFDKRSSYVYPGRKFDTYLFRYDTGITTVLGRDFSYEPNFIRLRAGSGNIYLHLVPLAFSNYFLLHKQNIEYYEKSLSVIPAETKKVVWDEYFYYKFREENEKRKSWLGVLLQFDAFRAAFWTLITLLLVYVLLEMRRKQRIIPVIKKPVNDSLDFVKTIGRLYYDKKDHNNLCRKMSSYFLEHVRSRYKLPTGLLDDKFVKNLHYKSGYPEKEISEIVSFINFIDTAPGVSDRQLGEFYKMLEEFYKKT